MIRTIIINNRYMCIYICICVSIYGMYYMRGVVEYKSLSRNWSLSTLTRLAANRIRKIEQSQNVNDIPKRHNRNNNNVHTTPVAMKLHDGTNRTPMGTSSSRVETFNFFSHSKIVEIFTVRLDDIDKVIRHALVGYDNDTIMISRELVLDLAKGWC